MLKLAVFLGVLAAVVVGIVLTIVGNRRRRREAERKTEEALRRAENALQQNLDERRRRRAERRAGDGGDTAGGSPTGQLEAMHSAPTAAAEFEPEATQRYMLGDNIAKPSAVPDRPGANEHARKTAQLISLGGADRGRHFPVPDLGLSIGRADDNDLVIVDSRVSAHHAWIGRVEGKVMLRDYQSLNGTFINADMNTPVSEVALVHGDTILFGGHGGSQYRLVID